MQRACTHTLAIERVPKKQDNVKGQKCTYLVRKDITQSENDLEPQTVGKAMFDRFREL